MAEPLYTYLGDHLGGSQIALEVLDAMREQNESGEFREFAAQLLPDIQADDRTLHSIAEKIGYQSAAVKKTAGWLLEKLTRLKLGHTGSKDFALFESLEVLSLGIQGKLCLWKALQVASETDPRLRGYDFAELILRAGQQYENVEARRLNLARTTLHPQA